MIPIHRDSSFTFRFGDDRIKAHFGQDNVFMAVDGNNQIVQGDRS